MLASSFSTESGGKGGNQAAACAKLSRNRGSLEDGCAIINMIGAVGEDSFGPSMISNMRGYGVVVSGIHVRINTRTGVAVIIVEETSGENRIMLSAGANATLRPEHFLHLADPLPQLLILQLEIPFETVMQILETARKQGVEVLLNSAPAVVLPAEAYTAVTHLILNESEAAVLAGCGEEQMHAEADLALAAKAFIKKGVQNVIITLGGRGVFYCDKNGVTGLTKARKVAVVDTTAAGDTFVGSYALEVVKNGFQLAKAVDVANEAAALTVQKKGAQISIPWASEVVDTVII
jgi:ribokinase